MTFRPWKVAPLGFETGKPLMGLRGTHVEMTWSPFSYVGDFLPHVCNDAAALMPEARLPRNRAMCNWCTCG
jgi:hypothetical protein